MKNMKVIVNIKLDGFTLGDKYEVIEVIEDVIEKNDLFFKVLNDLGEEKLINSSHFLIPSNFIFTNFDKRELPEEERLKF